jgi:hypothetical protein
MAEAWHRHTVDDGKGLDADIERREMMVARLSTGFNFYMVKKLIIVQTINRESMPDSFSLVYMFIFNKI